MQQTARKSVANVRRQLTQVRPVGRRVEGTTVDMLVTDITLCWMGSAAMNIHLCRKGQVVKKVCGWAGSICHSSSSSSTLTAIGFDVMAGSHTWSDRTSGFSSWTNEAAGGGYQLGLSVFGGIRLLIHSGWQVERRHLPGASVPQNPGEWPLSMFHPPNQVNPVVHSN